MQIAGDGKMQVSTVCGGKKVPGVVGCKSAQQAAAREVPGFIKCKLAQQVAGIEEAG